MTLTRRAEMPTASLPDSLLEELSSVLVDCLRLTPANSETTRHLLSAIRARLVDTGAAGSAPRPAGDALQGRRELLATRWMQMSLHENVNIQTMATACGLSPTQFSRAFKTKHGHSPQQWRLRARIEHAKILMKEGAHSLTEIAIESGFAEQSHFNHTFRKQVGMSPGAWRKHYLEGGETRDLDPEHRLSF
jgi:AraC-like DNA-binding protein